jgi:hypothetical protein
MMVALIDSKSPSPEEFDRLRAMIDEAQRHADTQGEAVGAGVGEGEPAVDFE